MTAETERWLGHFELCLHAKNRPGYAYDLADALKLLEKAKKVGSSDVIEADQRWILQLSDMKIDDNVAILLFLGIDKQRAEAIYGNIVTLDLRSIAKAQDEGVAVSAHLVITLNGDANTGMHKAVLEEVEGLSRSKLIPYIRNVLNKYVQFSVTLEDDSEKETEVSLVTTVTLDKPIHEQLNEAKLLSVQAVRKASSKMIDMKTSFYEKKKLIEFRPTHSATGEGARGIVSEIIRRVNKDEYPELRIRIEEDEGRERTVSANRSGKTDPLTSAFQLKTLVSGIQPALPQASKKVVKRLYEKMAHVLE